MPVLGIIASQMSGHLFAPSGAYDSIASASGGSSQIDFTSIPSTYTHLQLRVLIRDSTAAANNTLKIGFNNDLSAIYDTHNLQGDGSSAVSNDALNEDTCWVGLAAAASSTSNTYGVFIIDILDYANTNKYKTVRTLGGYDANGSGVVSLRSNSWRNTSAITSVKFYTGGTTSDSRFALYGIKGA